MKKQLNQLIEWHCKFNVPFRKFQPKTLSYEEIELRNNLMQEEVKEWKNAFYENNMPDRMVLQRRNRAKELADILYVVFGTIITEGLQDEIERIFDEVHKSNLSKLGKDGKPIKREDGKVLKGENYKEPDLSFIS